MSKMKSALAATFLTLALVAPGLAGNIGSPGYTPPPPPPPETTTGNIGSPGFPEPGDVVSSELTSPEIINILIALMSLL